MSALPIEIWERIADRLEFDDVRALACTCKYLSGLPRQSFSFLLVIDSKKSAYKVIAGNETLTLKIQLKKNISTYTMTITAPRYPISSLCLYDFQEGRFGYKERIGLHASWDRSVLEDYVQDGKVVIKLQLRRYVMTDNDRLKAQKRADKMRKSALAHFERSQVKVA